MHNIVKMNNSDNKRKRVIWSENEIKDMLAIFSEKNILTALDGKRFRNKQVRIKHIISR